MREMNFVSIVANGATEPIYLGSGRHRVGVDGDFGGGSILIKHNLPSGTRIGAVDSSFVIPGPCTIHAVLTGASNPNVTFYSQPIDDPE